VVRADRLVLVVRARAGDEDDRREGPLPAGSVSVPLSGGEPTPTGIFRTPAALVVVGVVVVTGAGGATVGGELPDG
jgi:hypothetical protein